MKGSHNIVVESNKIRYNLTVTRNITIIRGDSATGKTKLINLIRMSRDPTLEIKVRCDKKCVVLDEGTSDGDWEYMLSRLKDSIVFIDEGRNYVHTEQFARAIKNSDNYYVIVSREPIKQLPYSINEIYGLRESSKYGTMHKVYAEMYRIYLGEFRGNKIIPDVIITEDSNSGYDCFKSVGERIGVDCVSAHGKSNVYKQIKMLESEGYKKILAVVDGAAFGPDFEEIYKVRDEHRGMVIYAPESFEWILLKSGIIKGVPRDIMDNPSDYIESSKYFSWEQYFTALLCEITNNTAYAYSKRKLNKAFLSDVNLKKIVNSIGFLVEIKN